MKDSGKDNGIRRLIAHYRREFRIPENLNHYSEKDFADAEKNYIKIALKIGKL
jgi:hypothetical protein